MLVVVDVVFVEVDDVVVVDVVVVDVDVVVRATAIVVVVTVPMVELVVEEEVLGVVVSSSYDKTRLSMIYLQ